MLSEERDSWILIFMTAWRPVQVSASCLEDISLVGKRFQLEVRKIKIDTKFSWAGKRWGLQYLFFLSFYPLSDFSTLFFLFQRILQEQKHEINTGNLCIDRSKAMMLKIEPPELPFLDGCTLYEDDRRCQMMPNRLMVGFFWVIPFLNTIDEMIDWMYHHFSPSPKKKQIKKGHRSIRRNFPRKDPKYQRKPPMRRDPRSGERNVSQFTYCGKLVFRSAVSFFHFFQI